MPKFKVTYHSIDLGLEQIIVEVEAEDPMDAVNLTAIYYKPGYTGGFQRLSIEVREVR